MTTESQIRKLRDDLLTTLRAPCECARGGPLAMLACHAGKEDMKQKSDLLSWVLGENDEAERWVEHVADAARRL